MCTWMGVVALGWVCIAFRWMQFHSYPYPYFPVRRIDGTDEDGQLFFYLENLGIDSLTTAPGYDFSREGASIYNTGDLCEYVPRCHFPNQVLANAPQPSSVPADPAHPEPQPQPQPEPEPAVLTGLKAQLQQSHDQNVDMLRELGVDPCKVYREAHVQRVIDYIEPGTIQYRFCKQTLRNTQKLKSHIRSFHSRQEALQCPQCPMKVGDAYALKVHMCIHTAEGRKYLCNVCGKSYLIASKLNEHSKRHVTGCLPCEWCNKTFSEEKGLKDQKRCVSCIQELESSPRRLPIHTNATIAINTSPGALIYDTMPRRCI